MIDEEDQVPELERVTVLLLPEASAALIQGAAKLGLSRTDFINMSLIKTATLACEGLEVEASWLRWIRFKFRVWLTPK